MIFEEYWAIGLLATTAGFTVPIIVSDVPEQASATTSYAPTTVWGDILNFEYNGKTLNARRVRNRKRASKGQKANLQQNTLKLD